MYITVRATSVHGEIDLAAKIYYDFEVAKTNLLIQKDILALELLIKYTNGKSNIDDFNIEKYGTFTFTGTTLEFVDNNGDYIIKYQIMEPENHKNAELLNSAGMLGLL